MKKKKIFFFLGANKKEERKQYVQLNLFIKPHERIHRSRHV